MALVEPHFDGIGDLFAMVYEAKTGKLRAQLGGWAPTGLSAAL
jgi:hypothetical protein